MPDVMEHEPPAKVHPTPCPVFSSYFQGLVTDPDDVEEWDVVAEFVCPECGELRAMHVFEEEHKQRIEEDGWVPFDMCPVCLKAKISQGWPPAEYAG